MLRKPWPICTTDLSLFLESACVSPPCKCGLAMHSCHRGCLSAQRGARCFGAICCTGPACRILRVCSRLPWPKFVAMSRPQCLADATLLIVEVKGLCLLATIDLLGEFGGDAKTASASLHQRSGLFLGQWSARMTDASTMYPGILHIVQCSGRGSRLQCICLQNLWRRLNHSGQFALNLKTLIESVPVIDVWPRLSGYNDTWSCPS